jgi:hypothetical protein
MVTYIFTQPVLQKAAQGGDQVARSSMATSAPTLFQRYRGHGRLHQGKACRDSGFRTGDDKGPSLRSTMKEAVAMLRSISRS